MFAFEFEFGIEIGNRLCDVIYARLLFITIVAAYFCSLKFYNILQQMLDLTVVNRWQRSSKCLTEADFADTKIWKSNQLPILDITENYIISLVITIILLKKYGKSLVKTKSMTV